MNEFIFLMNFSSKTHAITLDEHAYTDMLASDSASTVKISSSLLLQPYRVRILKRSKR
nr:Beta-galactosidase C-terminal domain [Paenibacillus phytorum]